MNFCEESFFFDDENQTFDSIMAVILAVDRSSKGNLEKFILHKKGRGFLNKFKSLTPKQIHKIINDSIVFVEDGKDQIIREPSCLILRGIGDCKSFSLLCSHMLDIAGYTSKFRLVDQTENMMHIYNVLSDGTPLDCTLSRPFIEVNYNNKYDFDR